ncbi:MAG: DUF1295 domain-containing protein [Candidatus Binatia bacterium]
MGGDPWTMLWHGWLVSVALMLVLWLVQWAKNDAGLVDVGWTLGVGLLTAYYAVAADGWLPRRLLVLALVSIWAARLAGYILVDRVVGKTEEDARYQELRRYFGERAHFWFFWFFESQTILVVLCSVPMLVLMSNPRPGFSVWEILGVAVWAMAIAGEIVADRQLARWRASPANRGRTCRSGLWRYSRHPNYFFEWLHWWAYALMGIGAPYGWLTLVGPALMWLFLVKLTGIAATENHAVKSRADYRDYQRTTSMFVPWFPKQPA